jgi:hypothetical protein
VHGGDEFAREIFGSRGRAYWSQAIHVVLEKHGYLDLDEAGPEILDNRDRLRQFGAILVAELPETAWSAAAIETLASSGVPFLLEGLVPIEVARLLGVEQLGRTTAPGGITVTDPVLRAEARAFGLEPGGTLSTSRIAPVDLDERFDWRNSPAVALDDAQAAAWETTSWEVERWSRPVGGTALCDWIGTESPADRFPAIVRRGSLIGCSFGIFSFLAQRHMRALPGRRVADDRPVHRVRSDPAVPDRRNAPPGGPSAHKDSAVAKQCAMVRHRAVRRRCRPRKRTGCGSQCSTHLRRPRRDLVLHANDRTRGQASRAGTIRNRFCDRLARRALLDGERCRSRSFARRRGRGTPPWAGDTRLGPLGSIPRRTKHSLGGRSRRRAHRTSRAISAPPSSVPAPIHRRIHLRRRHRLPPSSGIA